MTRFFEAIENFNITKATTLGDILTVDFFIGAVGRAMLAAFIIIVGMYLAGWAKRRIIKIALASRHFDDTMGRFLASVVRYGILVLTLIFVLQNFGFQTASLVAIVGAAGLAIGLALQGVLTGVASGVMLVVIRPIKVGDYIEVGGVGGTVQDITVFTTELATLDNVQVIVPNTEVWSNVITNYSVYDKRRAEWMFGVSYSSDLKKAEEIIREVIFNDPRSLKHPEPFLQVNNLGASSVDFLVRCWVPSGDYFQYQADMKRAVKEAFDAGGIEIPFPTQTIRQIKG